MGRSKVPVICDRAGKPIFGEGFTFEPGRWITVRPGDDAVVFAFGVMVYRAVEASDALAREGFGLRVVNASSLKPFDRQCIIDAAATGALLTYEDHNVDTGLGAIVANVLADEGTGVRFRRLGIRQYGTSGPPDDLFAEQGLAPADLAAAARALKAR
jgi:transketolase